MQTEGANQLPKLNKNGRPLDPGKERYARNKRKTRGQVRSDAKGVAIEARMRVFNVSRAVAEDQDVDSKGKARPGFWTPLGRLLKAQEITEVQRDAGEAFERLHAAYEADVCFRQPANVLAGLIKPEKQDDEMPIQRTATSEDDHEYQIIRRARRMRQAMAALAEVDRVNVGQSATSVVWDMCIRNYDGQLTPIQMGLLREGLNALRRVL